MLKLYSTGSFKNTDAFLNKVLNGNIFAGLAKYGQMGVEALAKATPVDSAATSTSWYYEVTYSKGQWGIEWRNRNVVDGVPIAIILQYGHGTGTGGYVQGRDYINPAIRPVMDKIAQDAWKVVTSA